jgi:tetratricopeptide (TPR) repeat protein
LVALGSLHYGIGNLAQALAYDQQALNLAQRMNAQTVMLHAHAELGRVYWRTQRYEEALAHFQHCLTLAIDLGLTHGLSNYHRLIGQVHKELRQFDQARTHLEQAVQLAQKTNALGEQAGALGILSLLAQQEGDTGLALELSKRALQVAEWLDDPRQLAICAGRLGEFHAKLGQLPQARALLEQAVDALYTLGIRANEPALPHNLNRLANVLYLQGEFAAAEGHCHAILRILHEHGKTMFESKMIRRAMMLTFARCRHAQGHREEAIHQIQGLLESVEDAKERTLLLETLAHFTQTAALPSQKQPGQFSSGTPQ